MLIFARGHRIFVERSGTGRPLVLIHGLGTPSVWNRVRDPLFRSFDLVSVHLPGFGSSDPARTPLSVDDHALLIESLLETLGLRDAALCGISYGGQLAATIAARSPGRITSLAILCASGLMTRYRFLQWDSAFRMFRTLASSTVLRSERSIRRSNGRLYDDPSNQPEEVVREFFRMISDPARKEDWFGCLRNGATPDAGFAPGLARIKTPTMILWGKNDRVIPVRFAAEFQRRIPGSKVAIFDRCGHALPLERPAELCAALTEFLAQ